MASETPNNGRNRRRKDSWWDGQCTALALILAALLLVLCGILLKQGRMPWQQGEKTEAEAVSESGGAAEIPGGSMEASSGAESAGVPGGAEGESSESSSGAEESSAEERKTLDMTDMDTFLARAKSHGFTITSMNFQDAWNLDLERLVRCSLHVYRDGRLVPFCANYL